MTDFSFYKCFEADLDRWENVSRRRPGEPNFPVRIEKRIAGSVDIPSVVLPVPETDRFYFRDRRKRYETGAAGCAMEFGGHDDAFAMERAAREISRLWDHDPRFTLFGGRCFFGDDPSPEWDAFGRFRFILPMIEIRADDTGSAKIVVNLALRGNPDDRSCVKDSADAVRTLLMRLDDYLDERPEAPLPVSGSSLIPPHTETLVPDRRRWHGMVGEALEWLRENGVRKVVLARKKILQSTSAWNPDDLLRALGEIAEDSFVFFMRRPNGDAFLGRSPERLFRLENGTLASDAIAGTRRRSDHPGIDDRLGSELMASLKDVEEHRIVVDYIREHMSRVCESVDVAASRHPLKLRHLQHIITRVSGPIANGADPLATMELLHPTPAVGGVPPDASMEMIRHLEPFVRGWYAAPIGWMARDSAEFAVGIRSALACGNTLHLFGGAGIVSGSDPEMEWLETGHKMENFTRILGKTE